MKRSFNYTGRQRFDSKDFTISQYENGDQLEFTLAFHNREYKFNKDALVTVEAYVGSHIENFNMGTWQNLIFAKKTSITKFSANEVVKYRLKVIDTSQQDRPLLAWKDRISAVSYDSTGQRKLSLLPVRAEDLGSLLWKIEWVDDTTPKLVVNKRISETREITDIVKSDPDFSALVFPHVFELILTQLLRQKVFEEEESEWLIFAMLYASSEPPFHDPESPESIQKCSDWVDQVIRSFAEDLNFVEKYKKYKRIN